jgi:serine/threonine-protein kinase
MDWGIARQLDQPVDAVAVSAGQQPEPASNAPKSGRAKIFRTQQGAVLGTPAYMAPEQARGELNKVDQRSDLFSACVLFQELLTLEHHLPDIETVPGVLAAVATYEPTVNDSIRAAARSKAPIEFLHLLRKGMANDPSERYQSASEILARLTLIAQGEVPVECPVTMVKRASGESMRMLDRHPFLVMAGALTGVAAAIVGVVTTVAHLL